MWYNTGVELLTTSVATVESAGEPYTSCHGTLSEAPEPGDTGPTGVQRTPWSRPGHGS